jgi:alkylhydroperoxidase family enzyme
MSASPEERLTPLPVEEWSDEAKVAIPLHLRRPELYLSGEPDALPMPTVLRVFAHHLPLAEAWLDFSDMLASKDATLEPRLRELLILRLAWRTRSRYEWNQHVRMGVAEGLTTAHVHAVPDGSSNEIWTPLERALLDATDETIDCFQIRIGTWQALAAELDEAQLFEMTFVIGGYLALATVLHSVGLEADPPTEPIDAPEVPDLED